MRLVYLNGDPGIPLAGSKGASIHVREMAKALAERVDGLSLLSYRIAANGGSRVSSKSCLAELEKCRRIVSIRKAAERKNGGDAPGAPDRESRALAANDATLDLLESFREEGLADGVYERLSLWNVAGALFARRWAIPYIVELNAPLADEAARYRSLRYPCAARYLERKVLEDASRIIVVSEGLAEHVEGLGLARRRIVVMPNAVRGDLFLSGREKRAAAGAPRPPGFWIAFAGSLKPWHGVELLVEAFTALRAESDDYRLLIVGDGPLAETIRTRLLSSVPARAFRMTGRVDHAAVPRLLRVAHVTVAPYPDLSAFYFSPMKVFEYCALGKPVVASRIGQIAEFLTDGESALLTTPGDARALAGAIRTLREDGELRARLGSAAREIVRERSWDRNASEVTGLFRRIREESSHEAPQAIAAGERHLPGGGGR